jgi:hypothetical protein
MKSIIAILDADSVQVNIVIREEIDIGGRVQSSDERISLKWINQGGSVQAELTAPEEPENKFSAVSVDCREQVL